MPVYRPRCAVLLNIPNVGEPGERVQQEQIDNVTSLWVRAFRVRVDSNNHNEADEAEVLCSQDDAGIDPRFLRNAEIYIYIGNAADDGTFTPSTDNLRFVGIACEVERIFSEGSGKNIRIRALDYTTLFLNAKTFPPVGIPKFSDTLQQAWQRVCDNTGYYDFENNGVVSTVQRLRDKLVIQGNGLRATLNIGTLTIGSAVSARLAKLGTLQAMHGGHAADAWTVWQTACGSLGLISFIRGDRCIVTTATDFYTADDPPKMALGTNIQEITETRDVNGLSAKNIGIESFDPLTGKTIEAFWPPLSFAQKKKKLAAGSLGGPVVVRTHDYEIYDSPQPTTDPAVLEQIARRVWEERSRQELTGEIKTAEMFVGTISGASYDLLALQAGDRIRVDVDRDALSAIQQLPSLTLRTQELIARGYTPSMADYVTRNLDGLTKLPAEFQVRSCSVTLDTGSLPGSYQMEIRYVNRIDVSGSSAAGEGDGSDMRVVTGKKATK